MHPSPHEHTDFLGSAEDQLVSDPLSDDFTELWTGRAKKNREIFSKGSSISLFFLSSSSTLVLIFVFLAWFLVFQTVPHDSVTSWKKYSVSLSVYAKLRRRFDETDLSSIRRRKQDYIPQGIKTGHVAAKDMSLADVKETLAEVRGHLVEMPLQFLIDEKNLEGEFSNALRPRSISRSFADGPTPSLSFAKLSATSRL